ncbi:MAG TPA: HNH endonuclease signature motif containing protein [Streptosporangiaceae bacterium]
MTITEPAIRREQIPASGAADAEALRAALLARVRPVALGASGDAGDGDEPRPPTFEEWYGLAPDPDADPPDGPDAWLADLPEPLLAEYLAASAEPAPPEALPAGRLPRELGDGCGFAAGGVADTLPPGPVLAGFADDAWAAGLSRLSDDELIGVLGAARRLASWSAAMELAAVADLAVRRGAGARASASPGASAAETTAANSAAEHIGDEIAAALTLTSRAADALLDLALAMDRLPATLAALGSGRIDRYKASVIADEITGLRDEHAAEVERQILDHAPGQTTGQLRAATRRAVLAADPAAARERRQRAERDARVEKWDEHAGTAALVGRDLPPADVLAADHNLSALARSLKQAGADGTLDQLRAKVYLTLLTGQSVAALFPAAGAGAADRSGAFSAPDPGSCAGGSVNLTMPLATWLGLSELPGSVAGYGPLDADDSRKLAALLSGQPGVRWCLTLTGEQGRPVAHGCARAGPTGSRGSRSASGLSPPVPSSSSNPGLPRAPVVDTTILSWLTGVNVRKLEVGECSHLRESPHYRPPRSLQHLLRIRQATCSFPGCRRPAHRCDYDHTIPHDRGGRTCECNLAPLCRRHHRAKQAEGWSLAQSEPGNMTWTTPSGRSYATGPTGYAG